MPGTNIVVGVVLCIKATAIDYAKASDTERSDNIPKLQAARFHPPEDGGSLEASGQASLKTKAI